MPYVDFPSPSRLLGMGVTLLGGSNKARKTVKVTSGPKGDRLTYMDPVFLFSVS